MQLIATLSAFLTILAAVSRSYGLPPYHSAELDMIATDFVNDVFRIYEAFVAVNEPVPIANISDYVLGSDQRNATVKSITATGGTLKGVLKKTKKPVHAEFDADANVLTLTIPSVTFHGMELRYESFTLQVQDGTAGYNATGSLSIKTGKNRFALKVNVAHSPTTCMASLGGATVTQLSNISTETIGFSTPIKAILDEAIGNLLQGAFLDQYITEAVKTWIDEYAPFALMYCKYSREEITIVPPREETPQQSPDGEPPILHFLNPVSIDV